MKKIACLIMSFAFHGTLSAAHEETPLDSPEITQYFGASAEMLGTKQLTQASVLLSPSLGKYGQVGFYLGHKEYPASPGQTLLSAEEYGLRWTQYQFIAQPQRNSYSQAFFVKSDITLGTTEYKSLNTVKPGLPQNFFDVSLSSGVISSDQSSKLALNLGIGIGVRSYFDKVKDTELGARESFEKTQVFPKFIFEVKL